MGRNFVRQQQINITDAHIQNLIDDSFSGPIRKKKLKDEEYPVYEHRWYRRAKTNTDFDILKERYMEGKSVRKYA